VVACSGASVAGDTEHVGIMWWCVVVRVSLVTQNVSVAACCVVVCLRLLHEEESTESRHWRHLLEAGVIALAIGAQLASVAYKIAIEKDWLVVIAAGNKSLLASMTCCTLLLLVNACAL